MNFQNISICCPACKGELEETGNDAPGLVCLSCGRIFRILLGIPDLRLFPDPYLTFEADLHKAQDLADHFDQVDFAGLVAYYYHDKKDVPPQQILQYTRGLLSGIPRSRSSLKAWQKTIDGRPEGVAGDLLEVGCGTGPLLASAAEQYNHIVGIDIGLRWLILARKRLEECGLDIPLICGCAEALPFRDQSFDWVAAESTLENLGSQPAALAECNRVLRSSGSLLISTPNRYSLGPDPHTGIWAGGFLPDRWVAASVRRKGGIPPKRKLLSMRSLDRSVRQAGFQKPHISLPDFTGEQKDNFGKGMGLLIDLYQILKRLPVVRNILFWLGPTLFAVAQKSTVLAGEKLPISKVTIS